MPSVTTGKGTRQLLGIAERGIFEFSHIAHRANRNINSLQKGLLFAKMRAYTHNLPAEHEDQLVDGDGAGMSFVGQINCERRCGVLAAHLAKKCEQLHKVASTVLAEQEAHGDMVLKDVDSLKRMTVGIKCVDNIWSEILIFFAKLRQVTDAADAHRIALLPYIENSGMKLVEKKTNGGEEEHAATAGDGSVEEPSVYYLVDADDDATETETETETEAEAEAEA